MRKRTLVAVLVLLALAAAACGQKSGVALSAGDSTSTGGGVAAGTGAATNDTVAPTDTATGATTPGATPTGGAAAATRTPTGAAAAARPGGAAGTPAAAGAGGGTAAAAGGGKVDRTGIDDAKKEIVIGIHAPVTGAAPIDQKSFDLGKEVYWSFVKDNGGILGGYHVRVVFRDDQFSPTVARQKCQEMVENDKAFMLIGAAGADQITSCARYAESVGVPYISAGVNTDGLDKLKNYFALSMTYAQQAPLLAQLVKNQIKKTKVGLAVLDTPDFVDARQAAISALQANGAQIVADEKIPKSAGKSETDAAAANLAKAGAEVIYVLMSPTIYVNFVKSVKQQVGYDPDMVAPGLTLGLNLVATATCPDSAKLQVLSPFPELDVIDTLDPDYTKAYQKYVTANNPQQQPDDIGIALWGLNKILRFMFEASATDGKSFSRQALLAGIAGGKEFKTGVYPPVTYSATQHFGAKQAHLLAPDCVKSQMITKSQFASGF
jgi:branched-chain amino acid transport system substrate-binding protein